MTKKTAPRAWRAIVALALLAAPQAASAHFIWITVEPAEEASEGGAKVQAFFSEPPVPEGPEFLKYVKDLKLVVDGQPLPAILGEETLEARWAGKLPTMIDAERDLGVTGRGGKTFRLIYTARAQTAAVPIAEKESGDKLRVRLVEKDGKRLVQALFEGKPVANARLKAYPEEGEPEELKADDQGLAEVAGLAEGKTALWANHADGKAGELDGKPFSETRYYATLTFCPSAAGAAAGDSATKAEDAKGADAPRRPPRSRRGSP